MLKLVILPEDRAWEHELWPISDKINPDENPVQEGHQYFFELQNAPDPLAANLFLDELPVEALRPEGKTARWRWSPGFHAGSIEVRLELGDGRRELFEIITDPDLRKLTRDQFNEMVREILEDTFALFKISSFRTGVAIGTGERPPPIARLEFLRSRMTELVRTIEEMDQNPQRALRAADVSVPYHQAAGVTGIEILRSFRSGRILKEQGSPSRLPSALKGHLPERIRRDRKSSTFDIHEHRDVKASLKAWQAWMLAAADLLELAPDENVELRKLQALWAGRVRRMSQQLAGLLDLPLFAEVSDRSQTVSLTAIYRNIPIYRKFFRLHRDFMLGIANIFGDFLQLPLSRTFDLYELWCFLRLLRAAVERHGVAPAEIDRLFGSSTGDGRVNLAGGAITIPLSSGMALSFKLRFVEYWKDAAERGSYSRLMIPDIVLSGKPEHGMQLIVLDAKYRIDSALDDALNSIHMYRDALVQESDNEVTHIVRAAYLLSPHLPDALKSEWKGQNMPGRLFHPVYRSVFRFGALTLRPGMSLAQIGDALDRLVKDAHHGSAP